MPRAELFAELGLFVRPGFLEAEVCARLCAEMLSAPHTPAEVSNGYTYRVDESSRRTKAVEVASQVPGLVGERLSALLPDIAEHFATELILLEPLQFLRYTAGDFFEPHTDDNKTPDAFDFIRARRISVVIFLNESQPLQTLAYQGGDLRLFGLVNKPHFESLALPLVGTAGTLVAFRSDVLHEVTPVTGGERFTIVAWLSALSPETQSGTYNSQ